MPLSSAIPLKMAELREEKPADETAEELRAQIAELVKRSLMQIGDMREIEAKVADLTERIQKVTPPPASPV